MLSRDETEQIRQCETHWRYDTLKLAIEKMGERKKEFVTESGLPIKDIYTPLDLENQEFSYAKDLGFPGEPPNVRGVEPNMYRSRLWPISTYAGYGLPENANARYKFLINRGQEAFAIALDIPTQLGYDSDHPMAHGEVGRVGVAIDSLRDFEILFEGIRFDKVQQIRTTFNGHGPVGAAMFVAVGEKQGLTPDKFSIVLQNDILKEYIARGLYIYPPKPSMRMVTDVIEFCSKYCPTWHPVQIAAQHFREAGSTAVQEVAFVLADAIAYIESTLQRGISIDSFAKNLCILFDLHIDLFEEVAKLRAARKLWAQIMKDRFGAQKKESLRLRLLNATAGSACLAQQPLNNIVRITIQVLAGVLGGSHSIATASYDEALGIPTEEAVEIATRTQQIIAEECGVTNTIDPMGGSYYLESLTLQIEKEVRKYLEKIETMGGALGCIENGYFQKEISEAAKKQQKEIESGQRVKVGLNKYRKEEETPIRTFKVDYSVEQEQIKRLKTLKMERDNQAVKHRLEKVREAALGTGNLIPPILEAVKVYATIGEICGTLREVFGEYKEQIIF